ncbi:MAG TPA: hypothetical protein VKV05_10795 [Terriglobales bacterium]|nr:hypothetical protein [Terriglobales bacterium]
MLRRSASGRALANSRRVRPAWFLKLTPICDYHHGSRFVAAAQCRQRCPMPVLVIAVVFFAIFLVMGVMAITAMVAEHGGHLFSRSWSDEPRPSKH